MTTRQPTEADADRVCRQLEAARPHPLPPDTFAAAWFAGYRRCVLDALELAYWAGKADAIVNDERHSGE